MSFFEIERLTGGWKRATTIARRVSDETGISQFILLCDIIWCRLRYGAHIGNYREFMFHRLNGFGKNEFLTEARRMRLADCLNPRELRNCLDNKAAFLEVFHEFIHRSWLSSEKASEEQIWDFIRENGSVMAKPLDSTFGRGVFIIHADQVSNPIEYCCGIKEKRLLLEEVVKQHPMMASLNPCMVNTIRMITILDKDGRPFLFAALLRTGVTEIPVDNTYSGGVAADIDPESGIVTTTAVGNECIRHVRHPYSGTVIPGFQIPHWEQAKTMVLQAALVSPGIRMIGWDVAITNDYPLLIEGNSKPHEAMQIASQVGIYKKILQYL